MVTLKHLFSTRMAPVIFVLTVMPLQVMSASDLQPRRLIEVLDELSDRFQVVFSYETQLLENITVNYEFDERELAVAVEKVLARTGLKYESIGDKYFVIYRKDQRGKKQARKIVKRIKQIEKIESTGSLRLQSRSKNVTSRLQMINNAVRDIKDEREISGKVTSPDGKALIGVNIVVKNTSIGTASDIDGTFVLNIPDGDQVLVFSYTGYATLEVLVGEQSTMDVQMEEDLAQLDEVIVVGYGTVKKRDLTGSVGKVDVVETLKTPVARIDQALQGRVSGVQVTAISGQPGAGTTIRIRGGNSINAGNEPLYVVDGFIGGIDINAINPNDIESIEVLKDASALSIYGARGSNGVILITTKKGKEGRANVTFSNYVGVQSLAREIDFLGAQDFMAWANAGEAFLGNASEAFDAETRARIGNGTDWQDVVTQSAPMYNSQLAISGGSKKTQYYLSANYFNQEGILVGNTYNRSQLRFNLDHKFSDFFQMGTNVNLSRIKNVPQNFNPGIVFDAQPAIPVRLEDGSYSVQYPINGINFSNPLAAEEFISDERFTNQTYTNTYVRLNITPNLWIKSTIGFSLRDFKRNQFTSSQLPTRLRSGNPATGRVEKDDRVSLLTENTINYSVDLGNKHSISLLGGFTYQRQQTEQLTAISDNIQNDLLSFYGLSLSSPEDTRNENVFDAFRISSLIGRVNYSYAGKYLLTLTARQDGSSKFGENNRFAFFPALAFAWRLSEEPFIKNLNLFDHLKLRLSLGRSGNSNGIGSFQRFQTLGTGFTSLGTGGRAVSVFNQRLSNPDLRWETTDQFDLGLDFGFFNGKLSFEVDFFSKETKDLLFTREISSQTGFTTRLENVGSLKNTGVELFVNGVILRRENLTWDAALTFSTYKNEIIELGSDNRIVTRSHGVNVSNPSGQLIVGEPLGIFTGWNVLGVYADQAEVDADGLSNNFKPGEFRYEDVNTDGVIDQNDVVIIGNSNPDFYGGLQNTFTFGDFDLSAFLQFSSGNDIFNERKLLSTRTQVDNAYATYANAWSESNRNTNIPVPQAQNAQASTSFAVENASFLRLKNLTLGYDLPMDRLGWKVESIRVYLGGANVFQLVSDEYSNYDPEVNTQGTNDRLRGYDNIAYPTARTFTFGIDARF